MKSKRYTKVANESNGFKKLLEKIFEPFIAIAVLYDESKRIDENGDWERHYKKKEERRRKRNRETHGQ